MPTPKSRKNDPGFVHPIVEKVLANPFYLCTADELRHCLGKSINFVLAAKNAGAPFPGGTTRPEWFLAWLRREKDFTVKAHNRKPESPGSGKCASRGG